MNRLVFAPIALLVVGLLVVAFLPKVLPRARRSCWRKTCPTATTPTTARFAGPIPTVARARCPVHRPCAVRIRYPLSGPRPSKTVLSRTATRVISQHRWRCRSVRAPAAIRIRNADSCLRDNLLWRAGLPALGREAALKPATPLCQVECDHRIYDCFAVERGGAASRQARSPQDRARLQISIVSRR